MNLTIIQQKIFEIRGQKVMLDFDLAELYEVETKVFNQAIKRNLENFPTDFMFQLTRVEWKSVENQLINHMWSQSVTTSQKYRREGYLPYVFTEHGVTMLASILKSPKARQMNIAIVRAFIALKKFAIEHRDILEQLVELKQKSRSMTYN
nr:ORF6N domain-containing protein [uncultured Sediminibacterium sp.]